MPAPESGMWYWLYIGSVLVCLGSLLASMKVDEWVKALQQAWFWEGM